MIAHKKKPDFKGLYDKAKLLKDKIQHPSGKLLEKYKLLGAQPGHLGDVLKDNRLSPDQKAKIAHSLEGYRGTPPEDAPNKKKPPTLGRTRGPRRMI